MDNFFANKILDIYNSNFIDKKYDRIPLFMYYSDGQPCKLENCVSINSKIIDKQQMDNKYNFNCSTSKLCLSENIPLEIRENLPFQVQNSFLKEIELVPFTVEILENQKKYSFCDKNKKVRAINTIKNKDDFLFIYEKEYIKSVLQQKNKILIIKQYIHLTNKDLINFFIYNNIFNANSKNISKDGLLINKYTNILDL